MYIASYQETGAQSETNPEGTTQHDKKSPRNFASLWEAVFVLSDKMRHIVDEANDR